MPKTKQKQLFTRTLTLPNGKRKYIRAADKETLDKKYNELKAQLREGIDIGNTTTVAQMAQTWYDVYKKPNLDDGARRNLLYVVNTWVLPYIGTKQVSEVKPIDIRTIMAKQEGMSESLQQKTLQAIRGIFDAAVENHLIAQSPAVKGIKANGKPAEEKKPLTAAQTQMLLKAVKDTRAYIAVAVMLGTGLRKEELCGLMWTDLDLEAGTLTVNRVLTFYGGKSRLKTKLKSDAAHRVIPMPMWLIKILKAEMAVTNSLYVVHKKNGGLITDSSFSRLWGLITARTTDDPELLGKAVDSKHPSVKYGIDFHVHPHLLRHTCITKWIQAGLDVKTVQYLAGHATPELTLKIYSHYLEEERRADTADKIQSSAVLAEVESAPAAQKIS